MVHDMETKIHGYIKDLLTDKSINISKDLCLIGSDGILDSMSLVELCLCLEDYSNELDFEFNWKSKNAMSANNSFFRTVGTLTNEFIKQYEASK